ncbi:MAG: 2-C-methyl-D-erythritol 4-phosphate cytidylyltransferase [Bacilli bacterium]|nr:2-C-methyl-D-erythritol 4-phosphate cytidylyltransferase [Bacilli bacterium]
MNIAIVLAAGSGTRMGQQKQFIMVNEKPLFVYSLEAFDFHPLIHKILLVVPSNDVDRVSSFLKEYPLRKMVGVIAGGNSRQESTFLALKYLKEKNVKDDDIVLIHDAARPLVSQKIIEDNIYLTQKYGAVETACKAVDTLVISKNNQTVDHTLNRDEIYQSQTPQSFLFNLIYQAHNLRQGESFTDDAGLVKSMGNEVYIVEGDKYNFKITTPTDLDIFEAIINKR